MMASISIIPTASNTRRGNMKIHKIERCINCGGFLTPLTPNSTDLDSIADTVAEFKADPKSKCLMLFTSICAIESKSDVVYCLCSDCCAAILSDVVFTLGRRRRKILFRKF